MTNAFLQVLGLVAGCIITAAAIPRVVDIVREPTKASNESLLRNFMLALGNLMWVLYGYLAGATAIAVMCSISGVLNALILHAAVRSRRGGRGCQADRQMSG